MVEKIRTVLSELGYQQLRETSKEFRMRPLYRDSDNNTVLSIRKETGRWLDFKLGIGGNLFDLIELHSIDDISQWMAERDFDVSEFIPANNGPKIKVPKKFDKNSLLKLVKDTSYWEGRNIEKGTLNRFGGGVARVGKLANRYVFPIFNGRGEVVGFSGRDLLELDYSERPKWKHIGDTAYWVYPAQLNNQILQKTRVVILVESIGDVLALFNAGIENVICLFGINVGAGIVNYLLKIDAEHIVIALNNDRESLVGNTRALKIKEQLLQYFDDSQVEVNLPDKKDFGEMTPDEICLWNTQRLCQPVA
jgi:hypothetical protein